MMADVLNREVSCRRASRVRASVPPCWACMHLADEHRLDVSLSDHQRAYQFMQHFDANPIAQRPRVRVAVTFVEFGKK
jgi:hypothetical protein